MYNRNGLGLEPAYDIYQPLDNSYERWGNEPDHPLQTYSRDEPYTRTHSKPRRHSVRAIDSRPYDEYLDGPRGDVTPRQYYSSPVDNGTPYELYDRRRSRSRKSVPIGSLDPTGVQELSRRLSTKTNASLRKRRDFSSAAVAHLTPHPLSPESMASPDKGKADGVFSPLPMSPDPQYTSVSVDQGEGEKDVKGLTHDPFDENNRFDLARLLHETYAESDQRGNQRRTMGIAFRDLRVTGYGTGAQLNETFGSVLLLPYRMLAGIRGMFNRPIKTILQDVEGCVKPGEMLLVLGRPGSGCTSLLKALASYRDGFRSIDGTVLYEGLDHRSIDGPLRGDVVYSPEDDVHFPTLTVGQTLRFASATRAPNAKYRVTLGENGDRAEYIDLTREVLATILGLRHTYNTKVGNDMIRGVSGGERKRVSIAETMAARAKIAMYDNSSRGLDSSTALEFVTALRIQTNIAECTTIASIYQAGEGITQLFDKIALLNQGRLVYFGPVSIAVDYFKSIGFEPLDRQTTADFLVACTDLAGQNINKSFKGVVPRSPDAQAEAFRNSWVGAANRSEVENYIAVMMSRQTKQNADSYVNLARDERAKFASRRSRYLLSWPMQVRLALKRRTQVAIGDMGTHITVVLAALFQALIIGSVFYQMPPNTDGFFSRGGVLFFSLLYNSFTGMSEIALCYEQRPIVIRQKRFAMLHPSADAFGNTLLDFPIRMMSIIVFDIIVYWMTGLSADAGKFFIYFALTTLVTFCMTAFFRMVAAATKSEPLATTFGGLAVLDVALYTGYMIPRGSMVVWWKWLSYCNPVAFGFEVLLANEYRGRQFLCTIMVPPDRPSANQVCPVAGAEAGNLYVDGPRYLLETYGFTWDNALRNSMIIFAFWIFFIFMFLLVSNFQVDPAAMGGAMIFDRSKVSEQVLATIHTNEQEKALDEGEPLRLDADSTPVAKHPGQLQVSESVFSWDNITYDVLIKGKPRRLLNKVSGYVAPGKMTALMGESGAGKTTLLNVLAQRTDVGVVGGDFFVNGKSLPRSFQADTGYCQQQDVHLAQHTVREALQFSAMLRQPRETPKEERLAYVETVLDLLEMNSFADAIVGEAGEGLNVEQRKRLTIGVELAAKPSLLLFLDEPTSGLDAQAAWSIVRFLKKLAKEGQAILCTIHQPSGELFNQFDRLLLLQKGGKTVYFGDIGENSRTLLSYFEQRSGIKCDADANPAEYILDVIGAGATATTDKDWHQLFLDSEKYSVLRRDLQHIYETKRQMKQDTSARSTREYAQPFPVQLYEVTKRAFVSYWRNPLYIYTKMMLNVVSGLVVGSSFWAQGREESYIALQNRLFACFLALVASTSLSQHLQPEFIRFRGLFEIREKPSKMYTWPVMVLSALLVEIPWNFLGGTIYWLPWYYFIQFPKASNRAAYSWGLYMLFQMYYCTFAQAMAAISPNAMISSILFSTFFSFVVVFCGVVQPPSQLPYFWSSWMFRLSPFTWIMEGILGNAVGDAKVDCQPNELQTIIPPNVSCERWMEPWTAKRDAVNPPPRTGYYVSNPDGTCGFCRYRYGEDYLNSVEMTAKGMYRDLGIICAYIVFNTLLLFGLFWLFRIYKFGKNKKDKKMNMNPPEGPFSVPPPTMQMETPAMAMEVPHAVGADMTNALDHFAHRSDTPYNQSDMSHSTSQLIPKNKSNYDVDSVHGSPFIPSHPLEPVNFTTSEDSVSLNDMVRQDARSRSKRLPSAPGAGRVRPTVETSWDDAANHIYDPALSPAYYQRSPRTPRSPRSRKTLSGLSYYYQAEGDEEEYGHAR